MICFISQKFCKLEYILILLTIQFYFVSTKSGSVKVKKSSSGGKTGSKSSRTDSAKLFEESEGKQDNETDDLAFNLPDEQILISELLGNYDVASRPVFNASMPVVVKFNFALIQIIDMDERNQILTTNVWIEHVNN